MQACKDSWFQIIGIGNKDKALSIRCGHGAKHRVKCTQWSQIGTLMLMTFNYNHPSGIFSPIMVCTPHSPKQPITLICDETDDQKCYLSPYANDYIIATQDKHYTIFSKASDKSSKYFNFRRTFSKTCLEKIMDQKIKGLSEPQISHEMNYNYAKSISNYLVSIRKPAMNFTKLLKLSSSLITPSIIKTVLQIIANQHIQLIFKNHFEPLMHQKAVQSYTGDSSHDLLNCCVKRNSMYSILFIFIFCVVSTYVHFI